MTKVTYYMYPCDTCCMSSERMKLMTEIVPSVKIKTKGDIRGIMRNVNENETK